MSGSAPIEIPRPRIQTGGFPACPVCKREKAPSAPGCAMHGGEPLSTDGLRRAMLGTVWLSVSQIAECGKCRELPMNAPRCARCAYLRGAAMGIAGVAEQMGWETDMEPYMEIIGVFDPGWSRRMAPRKES